MQRQNAKENGAKMCACLHVQPTTEAKARLAVHTTKRSRGKMAGKYSRRRKGAQEGRSECGWGESAAASGPSHGNRSERPKNRPTDKHDPREIPGRRLALQLERISSHFHTHFDLRTVPKASRQVLSLELFASTVVLCALLRISSDPIPFSPCG